MNADAADGGAPFPPSIAVRGRCKSSARDLPKRGGCTDKAALRGKRHGAGALSRIYAVSPRVSAVAAV